MKLGHKFKQLLFAKRQLARKNKHLEVMLAAYIKQSYEKSKGNYDIKPVPCIVSLTSYGTRLESLHFTLQSILDQSIQPEKIVVWLAHGEVLPPALVRFSERVEFAYCQDFKSYKKLIPTLEREYKLPIITLDDDVIYPYQHLEQLWKLHIQHPQDVICHRAHRICFNAKRRQFAPYNQWQFDVSSNSAESRLCPIGIGGILYPEGIFYKDVTISTLFSQLAPNADDLWFKAMHLLTNTKVRTVSPAIPYEQYVQIPSSQEQTLWHVNEKCNDIQLAAILKAYPELVERLE